MADIRPISAWPKLLVGPMVRRVTSDRAHVFVATSVAGDGQLLLYAGRVRHDAGSAIATGSRVPLRRIGQRLWVGVVDVAIPAGTPAGSLLSYDLVLHEGGTARGLHALGLLGGTAASVGAQHDPLRAEVPLGYAPGFLPAFVLPPAAPADLRLVHASCRKPHGGTAEDPDALQLLDADLARVAAGDLPARERTQQLILTGDQIYADDVAGGLLQAVTEAGLQLLGWDEPIPSVTSLTEQLVEPGWRTRFLSLRGIELKHIAPDEATDYSANHLLRFGEWVGMYCFAWSDALWARNGAGDAYTLPDAPAAIDVAKVASIFSAADSLGFIAMPARATRALEVGEWLDGFRSRTHAAWRDATPKAVGYGTSVRSIRRVLANVATYTMFDDHEITDDWYLNRRVRDALQGAPPSGVDPGGGQPEVGPRLLRNGLSAYTIFQHWGNVPEDFAPGRHGEQVLDAWTWSSGPNPYPVSRTGHTRDVDGLLGLDGDSTVPAGSTGRADFDRLRFDYAIPFAAHRLIALDTRTWRSFPSGEPFSWASLAPLVPDPPGTAPSQAAAEVNRIASAWRQAGTDANQVAMTAFGDVLSSATVLAQTDRTQRAQLLAAITTLVGHLSTLLTVLPNRRGSVTLLVEGEPDIDLDFDLTHWFDGLLTSTEPLVRAERDALTPDELMGAIDEHLRSYVEVDFGPSTNQLSEVFSALADYVDTSLAGSAAGAAFAARRIAQHAGDGLYELLRDAASVTTGRAAVLAGVQTALQALDSLTAVVGVDRLAQALFTRGDARLGAGLIRDDALPWMVAAPMSTVGADRPVTLLLSPAPIFGNELVEVAQRYRVAQLVATGELGEEEMDFEAWTVNLPALRSLFAAVGPGRTVVVLSGDVHYAGTTVNEVLQRGAESTYVQLTSSPTRNSDGMTRGLETLDDLMFDARGTVFFHQADWISLRAQGSSSLAHLQRLATAELEARLVAVQQALDTDFIAELERWWASDLDLTPIVTMVGRVAMSPIGSVRALGAEMGWQLSAAVNTVLRFMDDPLLAVFGDFLTAGPAARQHLRQFYRDIGVDPSEGLSVRNTILWDHRADRIGGQPVLTAQYGGNASGARAVAVNAKARRTVGHSNLGFVRVVMDPHAATDVYGVVHDLRWYPEEAPPHVPAPGPQTTPLPRTDWMTTRHVAGVRGRPADLSSAIGGTP